MRLRRPRGPRFGRVPLRAGALLVACAARGAEHLEPMVMPAAYVVNVGRQDGAAFASDLTGVAVSG